MAGRIIVVEDEPLVRSTLARFLVHDGYQVREAADVAACRAALKAERADVVIVDLGLPGPDGVTLVRELRDDPTIDVMVVTQRSDLDARVRTLDEGADDYLVKPIELAELSARIRVLQRRRAQSSRIGFGNWVIDISARSVIASDGGAVSLTRGEFDLLQQLVSARGKIVSREALSQVVSRTEVSDLRTVDSLVSRVRRKLGLGGDQAIVTAPGFGYRIGAAVDAGQAARRPDP